MRILNTLKKAILRPFLPPDSLPLLRTLTELTLDLQRSLKELHNQNKRLLRDTHFVKNRVAFYLGDSESLTYLHDETPIFINTDDLGCPINFLNGGRYEEENFTVFLSFRAPGLPMLDIGANLGYYTLRMLPYYRKQQIYAFEPNARIAGLLAKSLFLNGAHGRVHLQCLAASDSSYEAVFEVPKGHAGGGFVRKDTERESSDSLRVRAEPLDSCLPKDFRCGLVKLDVEGHELSALRGMAKILARSTSSVVMFEKLGANSGIESELLEFFYTLHWRVYQIVGTSLVEMNDESAFKSAEGYFISGHKAIIDENGLQRDFFTIFAEDFSLASATLNEGFMEYHSEEKQRRLVAHGPYWPLARGRYRVTYDGSIIGQIEVKVCEHFGHEIHSAIVNNGSPSFEFEADHDLLYFELAMRATAAKFAISKVRISKLS